LSGKMTSHFAKPENALKRAEEYIFVGDRMAALDTLHSVLISKRHHAKDKEAQKVFERIMFKYLDLCVELREGKKAKDGLHQYKYVMKSNKNDRMQAQALIAPSLELVIRHFLSAAEAAAHDAQSKSEEIVSEIEDLDEAPSAETLLLSVVSGEGARGRTTRQLVTPWLKFLWETYRTVLEILRNNPHLEHLYAFTAQQAFKFCKQYNRKTEFRRLAEILRNHLQGLGKQHGLAQGVTLSNPETAQLLLEIRFAQLNIATQMELWQESFRSVEDVHNLMMQSKKSTPPEMMCLYYERLTQIFWQAKNYSFHALACVKYFNLLQKLNQDMTQSQTAALASQVLLAALAVSITKQETDRETAGVYDGQDEKDLRLAALLGFSAPLPRATLLDSLVMQNFLKMAYPELTELFQLLETKVAPLTFGANVTRVVEFVRSRSELCVYAEPLVNNAFKRLLQRLAPVFKTIKFTNLYKMASFVPEDKLERLLVDAIQDRLINASIDHRSGVVRFTSEHLDAPELKHQLTKMTECFDRSLRRVDASLAEQEALRKQKVFARVMSNVEDEHRSILIRKAFIEKRKEAEEDRNRRRQKEREERARQEAEAAQRAAALEQEEKARRQEELQEKLRQAKLDQLRKEIDDTDPQEVFRQKVQKLREEKEGMEKRMKAVTKRLNHLERARREEERPLLEALFAKKISEDKQYHEEQIEKYLADHKKMHEQKLKEKGRIQRILPLRGDFEGTLQARRMEVYAVKKREQDERKAKLREELEKARTRQKHAMAKREKIEEQKRIIEAEQRKKREAEEAERQRQHEEQTRILREKQEKLEIQAAKQRQKEEEVIKRRIQEEKARMEAAGGGGSSWRERRGGDGAAKPASESKWRKQDGGEESSWRARRQVADGAPAGGDGQTWRARRQVADGAPAGGEGKSWRSRHQQSAADGQDRAGATGDGEKSWRSRRAQDGGAAAANSGTGEDWRSRKTAMAGGATGAGAAGGDSGQQSWRSRRSAAGGAAGGDDSKWGKKTTQSRDSQGSWKSRR